MVNNKLYRCSNVKISNHSYHRTTIFLPLSILHIPVAAAVGTLSPDYRGVNIVVVRAVEQPPQDVQVPFGSGENPFDVISLRIFFFIFAFAPSGDNVHVVVNIRIRRGTSFLIAPTSATCSV